MASQFSTNAIFATDQTNHYFVKVDIYFGLSLYLTVTIYYIVARLYHLLLETTISFPNVTHIGCKTLIR